jgi:hypothetical protein
MDNHRDRLSDGLVLVIGLAVVGYVIANAFSTLIGVSLAIGGPLLLSLVLCVAMVLGALWNQLSDGVFGFRVVLPLALSTLWTGFWPAMKIWGAKPFFQEGMPLDNAHLEWWATTYSQWGGSLLLLFGGYAIAYWTWVWTRN